MPMMKSPKLERLGERGWGRLGRVMALASLDVDLHAGSTYRQFCQEAGLQPIFSKAPLYSLFRHWLP